MNRHKPQYLEFTAKKKISTKFQTAVIANLVDINVANVDITNNF